MDWIINLDDGQYKEYEEILRMEFKKEDVNGSAIPHIDKHEWKTWGITKFMHRTNIDQHLKNLINNNKNEEKAQNPHVLYQDEGDNVTPFL